MKIPRLLLFFFGVATASAAFFLFSFRAGPKNNPLEPTLACLEAECARPRELRNFQDIYFSFRTNCAALKLTATDQTRFTAISKSIDRAVLMWKAKEFIDRSGFDYARAATPQIKDALNSIDQTFWPSVFIGESQNEPVPIFYPGAALPYLLENVRSQAIDWRSHPQPP